MANGKRPVRLRFKIAIVLVLLGLWALILIPGFKHDMPTARKYACINNLRQIEGAKMQWALENRARPGDFVTLTNLESYVKYGWPSCPGGGIYTIGRIGEYPTCSVPGHSL
jgi:hypothetical protein